MNNWGMRDGKEGDDVHFSCIRSFGEGSGEAPGCEESEDWEGPHFLDMTCIEEQLGASD